MADTTNPDVLALDRQRALAQMLLKKGMEVPQGQMIGNRYVGAHPLQFIGGLAQQYVAQNELKDIDTEQAALAKKLKAIGNIESEDILTTLMGQQGRPELVQQGPTPTGGNIPIQPAVPTQAPNPMAALLKAQNAQSSEGKAYIAPLLANAIPKKTEQQINYEAAKVDGFKGSFTDYKNQMSDYQKEELKIQKQRLALEGSNANKPQIVETANGFVAVDARTGVATPVTANGQPLMGTKGNLPEAATKQVTGATNLKDAITNYKTKLESFSTTDMANPDARAKMGNAYNNMMLQAKEAYNLGVLNGPDYQILQSVVKDPTSLSALLVSKKTLNEQANDLAKQADVIIGNVYKTHQRQVPTNMQPQGNVQVTPGVPSKVVNFNDLK
jgi:hypothetical protein